MSDENQPNDVVDSQPDVVAMPAEQAAATVPKTEPDEAVATPEPEVVTPAPGTIALTPSEAITAETPTTPVIPDSIAVEAPAETAAVAPSPHVVRLADLDAPKPRSRSTGRSLLAGVRSLLAGRGWIASAVIAVLLIVLLFLPPISLAQRLGNGGGYTVLNGEAAIADHPDGLQVSRAAGAEGKLRVKLGSVPRADFTSGAGPDETHAALEALPAALVPKSPYYTISLKSREAVAGQLRVLIPNESEPWETLDLYAWDAKSEIWTCLPAKLDRAEEVLIADVDRLPASVLVVQNTPVTPRIVAEVESWPVDTTADVINEADIPGILIGTMGGTSGDATLLPPAAPSGATAVLVPTVRNWVPNHPENWSLVSNMLMVASDRTAHVENLLVLAQTNGYPGLVVDYRSVQPQDRDLYAQFVRDLSQVFHEQGLWLAVVVDTPQPGAGGDWNTGGYDWAALGAAVDQLRVVMPPAPPAYQPGGEAEQLIEWAVTQVARTKLMPVYSTLSTDGQAALGLQTVLGSLGEISVMQTVTESVVPGTSLSLTLGQVGVLEDPATQATSITVGGATTWLGTPRWLRARMDLVSRYKLGGVVLRDLYNEGNMSGLPAAVADFKIAGAGVTGTLPDIVWSVTDPAGQTAQTSAQLTQPSFTWTAPTEGGKYRLAATVAGVSKGALDIVVATPAPVMTDTVAAGEDGDTDAETGGGEEATETLKAAFVADVTVPDDTQFEKGESFTKTWQMKNAGTTDWPEDTVFVFSSNTQLGDVEEVEVGAVTAGETVDISVDMVAPEEDGTYKSTWVLQTGGKNIDGGGVYVQIRVGEAAAAPVSAPVAGGAFELGGHIMQGFTYANEMHYAGMSWAKEQTRYGAIPDGTIAAAHANGFKIQISALGPSSMVSEPGFEDKIASWVAQIAAAGADAIEVWNEPNIDREWQNGSISPQAYTSLLCKAYAAIKVANPATAVISAAPAPTGYFGGCGPGGCDDQPWMEGLYNAGAANCMDYIGAHHNQGATSPSATSGHPDGVHHSYYFLPQTQLYYNIFQGARQIFYTELGYVSPEGYGPIPAGFGWGADNTVAEQAQWLGEVAQVSSQTGMVRVVIVWNVGAQCYGVCGGVPDPQAGYNIIRPGGGCPACETLHNVLGSR